MKFFKPTSEQIEELKKPFGKLFKDITDIKKENLSNKFIISVGDVTTKNLIKCGIKPNVIIYDNRTLRKFIDEEKIENGKELKNYKSFEVINPAGILTEEVFLTVKEAINNKFSKIFVNGEEDLFVIPSIKFSEKDTLIFYGQPNEGVVMIVVDEKLKTKIEKMLKKFENSVIEIIKAKGHKNVLSKHKKTFEITKENYLTKRGDCIIAINADKGINDLSNEFKNLLLKGKNLTIEILCDDLKEQVIAKGSKDLILSHKSDIVIRKSKFIDSRTLAVNANKSANDLDKKLIEKISQGKEVIIEFIIEK